MDRSISGLSLTQLDERINISTNKIWGWAPRILVLLREMTSMLRGHQLRHEPKSHRLPCVIGWCIGSYDVLPPSAVAWWVCSQRSGRNSHAGALRPNKRVLASSDGVTVNNGAEGGLLADHFSCLGNDAMVGEIVDRASKSYDVAVGQYEKRVVAGLQPATPVINLFSVAHQERVLLLGNLGYLLTCFVLYVIMSKREKAFQLKRALTVYNLINVLVSGFVAFSILRYKLNEEPRVFVCNRGRPGESGLAYIFVLFYLQKFVEFMDTYAFILRKSFRQVTTLHLFHHASITVIVGSLLPFDYSGDMFMPILLNSVVHVMVYLHYFLTCIGLHSWWSPYLTSLQMGQFAFIFVHSSLAFLKGPDCGSPDFAKLLLMAYMGSMLLLFSDFFVRRYILHQPSYDMCGVIKSNHRGGPTCTTYYGNATLNECGEALVRMPRSFREFSPLTIVNYCYQLTPLNGPMPDLHVLKEEGMFQSDVKIAAGNRVEYTHRCIEM